MSYIGNIPTTVAFLVDTFSGNGSTTAFTLSQAPANTSSILVAVSGVVQDPSTYSVSGTTLTFSGAPPSGSSNISVRFLGIPASGVTTTAYRTVTEFTATAGQTTFNVPSYTAGYIDVYRNGVMLGSADYTATSGTTVVLANPATAGDLVEVISFYVSSVLNAIPAVAGAVTNSYLLDGSVTKAKMAASGAWAPAGTVVQTVNSTWAGSSINSTSATFIGATISITTTVANSKIFVQLSAPSQLQNTANVKYYLSWRNSLDSYATNSGVYPIVIDGGWYELPSHFATYHSPNQPAGTTITYRIYGARQGGSGSLYMYDSWGFGSDLPIVAMEIA